MLLWIHNRIKFDAVRLAMRTTVTIDDALYEEALEVADPGLDKADLVREARTKYGVEVWLEPGEAIAIHTGVLTAALTPSITLPT